MLQKVFSVNIFDFKHSTENESVFDFLLYLFPHFLKKAVNQGIFKMYLKKNYNDSTIQGVIDINRHIKMNIPFKGNVAYNKREYSYDNYMTELIRHTIEYLKTHPLGSSVLHNDPDMTNAVMQIVMSTPTYNKNLRLSIMNSNIKPIQHPHYIAYTDL